MRDGTSVAREDNQILASTTMLMKEGEDNDEGGKRMGYTDFLY
jgi:hypothetical protein